MPRLRMPRTEGVGEAQMLDPAEGGAAFQSEERVLAPRLRLCGILGLRDDVVVAGHQRRFLLGQQVLRPRAQTVHPA